MANKIQEDKCLQKIFLRKMVNFYQKFLYLSKIFIQNFHENIFIQNVQNENEIYIRIGQGKFL